MFFLLISKIDLWYLANPSMKSVTYGRLYKNQSNDESLLGFLEG